MKMYRRTLPVQVESLGDREVRITMSTNTRARDGHILEPDGCDLANYRTNPIVLWSHDPDHPLGNNNEVAVTDTGLTARSIFAPAGISHKADEICGLVKAGVIRAVSIGFTILEGTPIDPARPKAGLRATKWELLECSFVSVPADTGAVVTERTIVGNSSDINTKEVAGMADNRTQRVAATRKRMLNGTTRLRGLYDVAQLAYVLSELGHIQSWSQWEKEIEGDDSAVPAMLGEALVSLGNSLVAMTQEEVGELLDNAKLADVVEDEMLPAEERAYLRNATSDRTRAFRAVLLKVQRAGKAISAANEQKLTDAVDSHNAALKQNKAAAGQHDEASQHHDALGDLHGKLRAIHDKMGDAIKAAQESPTADAISGIAKRHANIATQLDSIDTEHQAVGVAMNAADDAVTATGRNVKEAKRCVRDVLAANEQDEDTTDVQTSDGTAESDGAKNDRAASVIHRRTMLERFASTTV